MVRKYSRVSNRGVYGHERLKAALQSLREGKALKRASIEFGIPAHTLRRHRDKVVKEPGNIKMGRYQTVLPEVVEQELKSHIVEMESKMFGLTVKDVRKLAFDLTEKMQISHPFNRNNRMAGKDWVQKFMTRHNLSLRYPQGTSIARASGFNKQQTGKFFELYRTLVEGRDFPPGNIWNMDETGLRTVQTPQKVITETGKRSVGKLTSAERGTLVTLLCACNAAGGFLPPMYIFPRKRMTETLMNGAPPQAVGYASTSGYVDSDLFLKWLEHFAKLARPSNENQHIIILDGHHSHKTLAAIDFCRANGIHLLTLPPHSTHKMQPLDRTYFKSLKSTFNSTADNFMVSNPGHCITIHEMARLSGTAFIRTATPEKALNGFKACGISPFDPEVFTEKDFAAVLSAEQNTSPEENAENQQSTAESSIPVPVGSDQPDNLSSEQSSEQRPVVESANTSASREDVTSGGSLNRPSSDHEEDKQEPQLPSSSHKENGQPSDGRGRGRRINPRELKKVPAVGDGRCLFRSLTIGMDPNLQSCERDGDGRPTNLILAIRERSKSDELRARVITYMCENIDNYSMLEGDAINADLPRRLRYSSVNDRILAMADPTAMPGELELISTAKVLNRPIYVVNGDGVVISHYDINGSFGGVPLFVLFESVGEDVGHYDCLIHTGCFEPFLLNTSMSADSSLDQPKQSENPLDNVTNIIQGISPLPKRLPAKKRTRKVETAAILTSSPYKNALQEKAKNKRPQKKAQQINNPSKKKRARKYKKKGTPMRDSSSEEEDWPCLICAEPYSRTRAGETWVECQVCRNWAHEECTPGLAQFICPNCDSDDSC